MSMVLTSNYTSVKAGRDPQTALRVALSMYNTGSQTRGFRNGYVAKVVGNAGVAETSPAVLIAASQSSDLRETVVAENAALEALSPPPRPSPPPKWNVFERATYDRETLLIDENQRGRT